MARNRENVRRIGRAAQAKHIAREREKRAPRSEDLARAIENAIRNHREQVMNTPEGRGAILALLQIARDELLARGYAEDEVRRKFTHLLKPRSMTMADAEEIARLHKAKKVQEPDC